MRSSIRRIVSIFVVKDVGNAVLQKSGLLFLLIVIVTVVSSSCIVKPILPGGDLLNTPRAIRLSFPAWSPNGKYIAYTSWIDEPGFGDVNIYFLDSDRIETIMTNSSYGELQWSPDGKMLLISRLSELMIISLDDQNPVKTMDGIAGAWSLDGSFYYLWEDPQRERIQLSILEQLIAGSPEEIIELEGSEDLGSNYGLSIGSEYLVASFESGPHTQGQLRENDLFIYDLKGHQLFQLGSHLTDEFDPNLFRDHDNWLVYLEWLDSDNVSIVFTNFSESCTVSKKISEEQITGISVSPDGRRLALTIVDKLYVIQFEDVFGNTAAELINRCENDPTN